MNKLTLNLKSFFILIIIILFLVITISNILIAKRSIYSIFTNQVDKYFDQSASFVQAVFEEKVKEVSLATELVIVPKEVINGSKKDLKKFLRNSINDYIDFFIYLPNDNEKESVSAGLFLYDIKALQKYLEKNINYINNEHFVNLQSKNESYGFLIAKKRVIDRENGQVLGTLIGGFEIGFNSEFLNKIKGFTNLKSVHIFSNGKALNSIENIPTKKSVPFIALLKGSTISLTQHRRLELAGKPIDLQVAMSSDSTGFNILREQLKWDLILLTILLALSFLGLIYILRKFLVKPLYSLKNYAGDLSSGTKNKEKPHLCINEYRDLQNYLQELFTKLLKAKEQEKEQYFDLLKAKAKLDENMRLVNEFVILTSTDLQGNITDVSAAFEKLSGYTKEDLLGKNHRIMKSSKTPPHRFKELWDTIREGKVWEGEICNLSKEGKPYWTHNIIAPNFEGAKVIGYTAVREDITNKKKVEELAIKDALTGLFNRRHIEESLLKAKEHYVRYKEVFCVIMMDIDYFKEVNDTYGHQKGDEVLKSFAKILKANARKTDVIGRWGGEEFIIYMPKTNLSQGEIVAEKIRSKIALHSFDEVGTKTASFGVSQFHTDVETTIKEADEALYRAKELGRNQVQLAKMP